MVEKLLLRPADVAEQLSISRTRVYELIERRELHAVRIGRGVRVAADEVRRWVEAQTAVEATS